MAKLWRKLMMSAMLLIRTTAFSRYIRRLRVDYGPTLLSIAVRLAEQRFALHCLASRLIMGVGLELFFERQKRSGA
jgi:hypothetical protein